MKKSSALLITGLVLGLFLLSMVSAAPIDTLKNIFSGAGDGLGFQKVLLFLLVTLLVYSIVNFIPLLGKQEPWLKGVISIIIGLLGTMWLGATEIYSILNSYETLGIVLTTFIPLIIFMTFTIELVKEEPKFAFISKIMCVAFFVIMTIKYISPVWAWFTTGTAGDGGIFGAVAYLITSGIALFMIFGQEWVIRTMFKQGVKAGMEKQKLDQLSRLEGKAAEIRERMDAIGDTTSISYKRQRARLYEIEREIKDIS